MLLTDIEIQKVQTKIAPIIGLQAWGVSLGTGSFITLEFGKVLSPIEEAKHQHGEWHLWIYCSVWRLEIGNDMLVGSEDSRPMLESAIKHLEGATLRSVIVTSPAFDTLFEFEASIKLRVFPISFHDDYEHWMLYTPDGNVLTIGPGVKWDYQKSSEQPT